jgi:hypothetical protein
MKIKEKKEHLRRTDRILFLNEIKVNKNSMEVNEIKPKKKIRK